MTVQSSGRNLLDETAGIPLYIQLLADFEARIASGQWAAESLIPSEQSLCEMYGVSRTTVRQALRELTARGLLYRKAGRGSFVMGHRPSVHYQKYVSYTDELRARGHKPSSRFISLEQVPADMSVAIALRIDEGDEVVRLTRLRLADEEPIVFSMSHLPVRVVPTLNPASVRSPTFSLHAYLREHHNCAPTHCHAQIFPDVATEPVAAPLGLAVGTPLFRMHTQTVNHAVGPVEFAIDYIRADRFSVELSS